MSSEEKTFGVTVLNSEFLYVTAEDDSEESIHEAILAGNFRHVCDEGYKIVSVHEIKG